ncbi:hypothetical protein [Kitasatospora sp. A2-31]|uniref:hypothetical protein n=1 Tax=Kitasatospora sp. A2-31 TaxID=2916414 RepID=UPI001EEDB465|nr:hypothetical protein [Kitasatospora sp. A2-31]MCG6498944.1 hypothetical protein [Kitasatospora sp. A2-31]
MRAKTEQREAARRLRAQGRTYDEIQAELGVSKSSISLWVRDLPAPVRAAVRTSRGRRDAVMATRAERHRAIREEAAAQIGEVSARDLLLIGVALYWAEGAKAKPDPRVVFVNSDPMVIRVFERWLDLVGVERSRRRYAVSIHETADIEAAELFWADVVGAGPDSFNAPSVKRHNPKTNRKNTGETHRGCLRVTVLGSADLYRRIEGWWSAMVVDAKRYSP